MNPFVPPTPSQLIPLSEDERLTLVAPREFYILEGETPYWDEVTRIGPGERRAISLDIHVEARAQGQMIRVFDVPQGSRLTIYYTVSVADQAKWQNIICIRGRGEVKIRRAIEVFGEGAEVRLGCLALMENSSRISVADEIFSYAPKVKSDVCTKIVLKHEAKSEARGRIVVDERSAESESYEKLDHIIFGERAAAVVIPELEVKTDHVKCGHGATTSRPTADELFYFTSRGLSPSAAEQLLARGFLASALASLAPEVRERTLDVVLG